MELGRLAALVKQVRPSPVRAHGFVQAAAPDFDVDAAGRPELAVACTRPAALYACSEAVSFVVQLVVDGLEPTIAGLPRTVTYSLTQDGVDPTVAGSVELDVGGTATIEGSLQHPGFLTCAVAWAQGGRTLTATAAAAVEPTRIGPSLPPPEDFDAFWAVQRAELAAVPPNARLLPVPSPRGEVRPCVGSLEY
jgi:hypothetical protein